MRKIFLTALCGLLLTGRMEAVAQHTQKCATHTLLEQKMAQHPEYRTTFLHQLNHKSAQDAQFRQRTGAQPQYKTTAALITIPVVFHVILPQFRITQLGGTVGIYERMLNLVDAVNKDFMGKNADSNLIPAAFKPMFGKADMRFAPARRTPTNQCTDGYQIINNSTANSFSVNSNGGSDPKTPSAGGVAAWDPEKYLNIWVVDISEPGILGYTIPPSFLSFGFTQNELGIVLDYGNFGKRVSASQFFSPSVNDLGRTLTHELGHFFELDHTFGGGAGCPSSGDWDDGIGDTPAQDDATYTNATSCPVFPLTDNCTTSGNGIMWMNFMDYVDDRCMYMFTTGQVNMMRSQFQNVDGISYKLSQHPEVLIPCATDVADVPAGEQFSIFPNPSNGDFTLAIADGQKLQQIEVLNMMGQRVLQIEAGNSAIANYHIDLTGFSKGIYTVQCTFASGTISKKIVLQ